MNIDIRAIISRQSFWVIILLGLAAQAVPYILTQNAPAADGQTLAGFPFSFYSFGGLCSFSIPARSAAQCPSTFIPLFVFFDAVVVVGTATAVAWYRGRRGNNQAV